MRPTASLRWRAAGAGLLILVLLLYARQNSETRAGMQQLHAALAACEQNGESVVAKLKVVHQHKVKIDELYKKTVNDNKKNTEGIKENLRRCELNHLSVKERLSTCEQSAAGATVPKEETAAGGEREVAEKERAGREGRQVAPQPIGGEQQRLDELVRRNAELEKQLNDTIAQLESEKKNGSQLKQKLEECEQQLVAHVGALPKPGYSANQTAHFERKHDKDANLEFHRDADAPIIKPVIMSAKELVRRLEEEERKKGGGERGGEKEEEGEKRKKEREEQKKHPQDREQEDEYVAEKPNAAEQDYKEQDDH